MLEGGIAIPGLSLNLGLVIRSFIPPFIPHADRRDKLRIIIPAL